MNLWSSIPKRLETFQQYKGLPLHTCPRLPCTFSVLHSQIAPLLSRLLTLQDLDNGFIDEPPTCPHVAHIWSIARRYKDRIEGLDKDLHRQAHNINDVEAVNEGLDERVFGLAAYNCIVVNDLDATRTITAASAASARKYKRGMGDTAYNCIAS